MYGESGAGCAHVPIARIESSASSSAFIGCAICTLKATWTRVRRPQGSPHQQGSAGAWSPRVSEYDVLLSDIRTIVIRKNPNLRNTQSLSPGAGRLMGLLLLLPLLPQLVAVQPGKHTTYLPGLGPRFLPLTRDLSVLRRDIQGTALAVFAVRDVEVRSVQLLRVAIADTSGIAATVRGFREAALDHGFHGAQESRDQSPLDRKNSMAQFCAGSP